MLYIPTTEGAFSDREVSLGELSRQVSELDPEEIFAKLAYLSAESGPRVNKRWDGFTASFGKAEQPVIATVRDIGGVNNLNSAEVSLTHNEFTYTLTSSKVSTIIAGEYVEPHLTFQCEDNRTKVFNTMFLVSAGTTGIESLAGTRRAEAKEVAEVALQYLMAGPNTWNTTSFEEYLEATKQPPKKTEQIGSLVGEPQPMAEVREQLEQFYPVAPGVINWLSRLQLQNTTKNLTYPDGGFSAETTNLAPPIKRISRLDTPGGATVMTVELDYGEERIVQIRVVNSTTGPLQPEITYIQGDTPVIAIRNTEPPYNNWEAMRDQKTQQEHLENMASALEWLRAAAGASTPQTQ